ncbi:hypothetical protein CXG81DRAFT_5276, partial [Caulochytrium protostelioides]
DKSYILSGYKDHQKTVQNAQLVEVVNEPSFKNYFSALPHHPAQVPTVALKGQLAFSRAFQQHGAPAAEPAAAAVTGRDRVRFFRTPANMNGPLVQSQIVYARRATPGHARCARDTLLTAAGARADGPTYRTVGVQTQYRESSAQTTPYSPNYVIQGTAPPELLTLANLTWGAGLPATQVELELIERGRAKRAWEKTLPQGHDPESYERRLRMMETMELEEWKIRENEIRRVQEQRLALLAHVIAKRQARNETIASQRLERLYTSKLQERDQKLLQIQRKKEAQLRKIAERRVQVTADRHTKRDIINDYADYASERHAPKLRDGMKIESDVSPELPEHLRETLDPIDLRNMYAILHDRKMFDVLPTLPSAADAAASAAGASASSGQQRHARLERVLQRDLELMRQRLTRQENTTKLQMQDLQFVVKIEKAVPRPTTPTIADLARHSPDPRDRHAVVLQRLLRCREIQQRMREGKDQRLTYINELRSPTHLLRAAGVAPQHWRPSESPFVSVDHIASASAWDVGELGVPSTNPRVRRPSQLTTRAPTAAGVRDEGMTRDDLSALVRDRVVPGYVAVQLDFLNKEAVRLRQEQKIMALVRLAEIQRSQREARETQRRDRELAHRQRLVVAFDDVSEINERTLTSYLCDVIDASVDDVVDEQARQEIQDYVAQLNIVIEDDDRVSPEANPHLVSEMLRGFLIPEVERATLR